MPTWAAADDVRARVSYATIDSNSRPTTAQVEQWIDEAEGEIRGVLAAAGQPITYTATDAVNTLTGAATDYAEGHVRRVFNEIEEGDKLIARFDAFIESLKKNPTQLAGELAQSDVASSTIGNRSYATDNNDGLSIENGDFEPLITTTWKD